MNTKTKQIKKNKGTDKSRYITYIIIGIILVSIFYFVFYYKSFSFNSKIDECPDIINHISLYKYISYSIRGSNINGTDLNNYQFEYDTCHLYYLSEPIGNFTLYLTGNITNASVLAPVNIYDGMLFVPLSSPSPNPNDISNFSSNYLFWGGVLAANSITGMQVWVKKFPDQIMTQPLVVNGLLYVGLGSAYGSYYKGKSSNGNTIGISGLNGIAALNATTGNVVWYDPTIVSHMASFVYYNGSIIVVPGAGLGKDSIFLYDLNATTGKQEWYTFIGGYSAMSSPVFFNGNIYFGAAEVSNYPEFVGNNSTNLLTYNDTFFALNLSTKKIIWSFQFNSSDGTQDNSPIYYNGIIVTGFDPLYKLSNNPANVIITINLAAFNASNGKILWRFNEGNGKQNIYINLPPLTTYNGTVYSDTVSVGKLYAINITTGKADWSFYTGATSANANVYKNHIFISNNNGTLFVLNTNGTLYKKFNFGIGGGPENLAFIGNNILIYGLGNRIISMPVSKLLAS